MRAGTRDRWLVAGVLVVHCALLAYSDWYHSPTRDEIGHLAAGLAYLSFGRFDLYNVNPPAVRLAAALPVYCARPRYDWTSYRIGPGVRSEWAVGTDFMLANGPRSMQLFLFARLGCIPFCLLGAWVCYRWASDLFGPTAGIASLCLWCFSPFVLGHGSQITPDVPTAAVYTFASYRFWRWLREPDRVTAAAAAGSLGLALYTRSSCLLILPPLWIVLWSCGRWLGASAVPGRSTARQLAVILLLGLGLLNLGYAFSGSLTPLGEYRFVSGALSGRPVEQATDRPFGNLFQSTSLGRIPVPLPRPYVEGIDVQKVDFEQGMWSYMMGRWKYGGWWHYYLYGLAVKAPLGELAIYALACLLLFQRPRHTPLIDEMCLLAPAAAYLLLVSSQTGFSQHVRYAIPSLPLLMIHGSRLFDARNPASTRSLSSFAAVCVIASIAASLCVYPHSQSFFNSVAGGPAAGYRHLLHSNTDWGQDVLPLFRWLQSQGLQHELIRADVQAEISLRALGVALLDVPACTAARRDRQTPGACEQLSPGWYALSVNSLHDREGRYGRFLRETPTTRIGYTIYVYHLTQADASRL